MGKRYHNEKWLREQYWDKEKTTGDIAEMCGVTPTTISDWMGKRDIPTRPLSEAREKYQSEEWLQKQYHKKSRSIHDIADSLDVNHETIRYWMDKHEIERRNRKSAAFESARSRVPEKLKDEEWLREKYHGDNMTQEEIGELVGRASFAVHRELVRQGIETHSEGPRSGEDSPFWKGGKPKRYGHNWERQREKAIQRDEEQCRVCGMSRQKHREKYGRDIDVHHIDPIVSYDNPEDANELDNLITLCRDDHLEWEGIPLVPQTD